MAEKKKYYLAYGSNLNLNQMAFRCPTAKPVGTAKITGYELLYKGSKTGAYLTIEPKEDSFVPVAVWEVNKEDEKHLDVYEGFPHFYYKKYINIQMVQKNGRRKRVDAFVYIMHEERKCAIPDNWYVNGCTEGYNAFGFDTKILETAFTRTLGILVGEIKSQPHRECPICGRLYTEPPAISRVDNKTEICPDCGINEALEAFEQYLETTDEF